MKHMKRVWGWGVSCWMLLAIFSLILQQTTTASNDDDWWSLGSIGGKFQVQGGSNALVVRSIEASGPGGLGGLQVDDYIYKAFGKEFDAISANRSNGYKGAPQDLASAIERAESTDGVLNISVIRSGAGTVDLTINLPIAGAFGPAYPLGSAKFDAMYEWGCAEAHARIQSGSGFGYATGYFGLVLLSHPNWNVTTGDKPYGLSVTKMKDNCLIYLNGRVTSPVESVNLDGTPNDGSADDSNPNDQSHVNVGLENWSIVSAATFLAEYRRKSGDTSLDADVQNAADMLTNRIHTVADYDGLRYGRMGHGGLGGHYGNGALNIINAHAMSALAMLKGAGATINDTNFQASWSLVSTATGSDGAVGYVSGAGGAYDSMGRTAGVAFGMENYGGMTTAQQAIVDIQKDYVWRQWERMQHTHAYTVGGVVYTQFVLPYLEDRQQRYLMENQRLFYHFSRNTAGTLSYFGGRYNNGGDSYVNTTNVAIMHVCLAQAIASGNLPSFPSPNTSRIHAGFTLPHLTWPTIDARQAEISTLSQAFTVDVTDYEGTALLPADYTATWTHVSGPATTSFSSTNTVGTTATFPQDGTYRIQLEVVKSGYTLTEPIDVIVDTSGGVTPTAVSIANQPTSVASTLGGSAGFSVAMLGDGPFVYEWFVDGISMQVSSSTDLNLTNLGRGHVGDYHCVVTHAGGTVTSDTVSLTLTDTGVLVQGGLWRDEFDSISGSTISDLTGSVNYPRFPDSAEVLTSAESAREIGDNYGSRWTGWIKPDVTGSYTFYLAADYRSELWLSTDEQPANKALLLSQVNTLSRHWDDAGPSITVSLTAGQNYFIEVLHKETTGSDYCGLAWQKPGEGVPVDESEPIPGKYLSYFTGGVQTTAIVLPPVFDSSVHTWNVDETIAVGTSLGTASATDANTPLTYAIIAGDDASNFSINSATGEVTLAKALDFEAATSYKLTIQVTNSIGLIGQVGASITVNDIYDAQFIVNTNFEDSDGFTGYSGHATLTTATDGLGNQWSTPNDGRIWSDSSIPPIGDQCLVLGVAGSPSTAEVVIPGTDHGVSSVTFDYASYTTGSNAVLALSYRVSGGAWVQAWSTTVIGLTPDWQVKPWAQVNVDINQSGDVDLKIESTGSGGALIDAFQVKDFLPNVAPVATDSAMTVVNRASVGTLVGTVGAADANVGDPLTYAITAGNTGSVFAIDSTTGEITVAGTLDNTTLKEYSLTVTVTDTLGLNDTATITITLNSFLDDGFERTAGTALGGTWIEQTNDSQIIDTADAGTQMLGSVNAGETFAAINSLTGTYVDGMRYELSWNATRDAATNGTLNYDVSIGTWDGTTFTTYTSATGSIADLNETGKVAGPKLYLSATATEDGQTMAVRLEVTAGSADWVGFDDVLLSEAGVNTAPVFATNPIAKADGTQDISYSGTSLATDVTDTNVGDTLVYSKTAGPAWLSVAADGTLSGIPTNSDAGANVFTVRVTDAGGLTADSTLNITVLNVNDAPAPSNDSVDISEHAAIGASVFTVLPADPDAADTHTFAITDGNSSGAFAIDNNGNITNLVIHDYETTAQQYLLTVEVTDQNALAGTCVITVNVTDVHEAPVSQNDSLVITEDVTTIAGGVLANDTDNSVLGNTVIGFAKSVALYDAGTAGSPQNPTTQGWTENDPEDGDITTGTLTAGASINDNGSGKDAWIVTDSDTLSGIQYSQVLSAADTAEANVNGWVLESDMRFIDDFGSGVSTVFYYGNGSRRFLAFFELDSNGDLTVLLWGDGGATYTLTSGGTGTQDFHNYKIIFDPSTSTASFLVDGVRYDGGSWTGNSSGDSGVFWGNGSSGNKGSAAFHKMELSIFEDTKTLASGATLQVTGNDVQFDLNDAYQGMGVGDQVIETVDYFIRNGSGYIDSSTLNFTINGAEDLPAFDSDPIVGAGAMLFEPYTGTLADHGDDVDTADVATFRKVSGPAWLSIASDGTFSGTPESADAGLNSFSVEISDGKGGTAQATLQITVADSANLFSDNFESYDIANPSDFSVSSVASGNWTVSDTSANATRTYSSSNFGGTRLWISNVDGTSLTSKGIPVGSNAHYSMSAVLVAETGGNSAINAEYDILVGQTEATATSIIGGAQAVIPRGDPYQVDNSKTDHVFTHNFQTGVVNAGDLMFVRFKRVSGASWFGVDDVQVDLVNANRVPVASDATFSVDESSASGVSVGTVSGVDADAHDNVSFAITAGNGGGEFAIDSTSGEITTSSTATDYETTSSYLLTVTVTDLSGQSDTASITVNVNDGYDDADTDKLDDTWETMHYPGLGSVDENSDTDGDGFTAFQEMVFGMNPNVNDSSVAPIQDRIVNGKLEVKFRRPKNHATLNVTYVLQSCDDLQSASWAKETTVTPATTDDGTNEWVTYLMPLPSGAETRKFYRCVVTPNP